jgi:DNA-binding transcriptional LysR family regulator
MMGSREGGLVEVLPEMVCESTPIHALSLPTRHKLPKVKVFVDLVASELARQGVVT